MKNAIINARIESELKVDVESILKKLGLTATQAINIFYQQIKLNNGIPFEVKIPNDETKKVIEESRKGINIEDFSFDELNRKWKLEDTKSFWKILEI